MIANIPRISVSIITYNQEKVISRAIESLLAQREYIYEICVSDDCSTDGTWNVVNDYSQKYPGLFKLNRNAVNVGIFENIEKTWEMPTGDLLYRLAGDDECGKDWFKTVVDFINLHKIPYKEELFCIYGDYEGIDPMGGKVIHKNAMVTSGCNMMSLSLRGIVGNRSACFSTNVLKKYFKVSQGRSHIAESAIDRQLQLFSEKSYYIPKVGNIYHTGIGVSTRITSNSLFEERKQINPYMIKCFYPYNWEPSIADRRYMKYDDAFMDFLRDKTLGNALRMFLRWVLSYDLRIGIKSLNIPFMLSHLKKVMHKS